MRVTLEMDYLVYSKLFFLLDVSEASLRPKSLVGQASAAKGWLLFLRHPSNSFSDPNDVLFQDWIWLHQECHYALFDHDPTQSIQDNVQIDQTRKCHPSLMQTPILGSWFSDIQRFFVSYSLFFTEVNNIYKKDQDCPWGKLSFWPLLPKSWEHRLFVMISVLHFVWNCSWMIVVWVEEWISRPQ